MGIENHEHQESPTEVHVESSHKESTQLLMSKDPTIRSQGLSQVKELDPQAQEAAAQLYFDSTIGGGEMPILGNLQEQYTVYMALSDTSFGAKFRELEDARLKKYGYGGFSL